MRIRSIDILWARFSPFLYARKPLTALGGIFRIWRCSISDLMINDQIRDREVRLIDSDGRQLGIVPGKEAQRRADEQKMDLVKISPTATPPVCKIMDYSRHRFEEQKKKKEARKKQKNVEVKELRLSQNIDVHDINVKIRKCVEFLKDGAKVKISIRFRGREVTNQTNAHRIMKEFADKVENYGSVEKPPKLEARTLAMFLTPKQGQSSQQSGGTTNAQAKDQ